MLILNSQMRKVI